jgi:hypothetical protein
VSFFQDLGGGVFFILFTHRPPSVCVPLFKKVSKIKGIANKEKNSYKVKFLTAGDTL